MALAVYINGQWHDCLSINCRAIHYGDGVFETLLVKNSQLKLLDLHLERLFLGVERLGLCKPDKHALQDELLEYAHQYPNAIIKLILAREQIAHGYRPSDEQKTTTVVIIEPLPPQITQQLKAQICHTRVAEQPALAQIKHLNRLEQVLASRELKQGFDEGILFLHNSDELLETISSNIFIIKNNKIYTPRLDKAGVAGVARKKLQKIAAQHNIEIIECKISKQQLLQADGVFVSNSIMGLRQIVQIDGTVIGQEQHLYPQLKALSKKYFIE